MCGVAYDLTRVLCYALVPVWYSALAPVRYSALAPVWYCPLVPVHLEVLNCLFSFLGRKCADAQVD